MGTNILRALLLLKSVVAPKTEIKVLAQNFLNGQIKFGKQI